MIVCKSAAELETMHRAGLVVWDVLNRLRQAVQPGISTLDLEKIAAQGAQEHGARPAFKGYRGYPCVLCASINQEVVHGIPSGARRLKEGDIISLDFGVELNGYYGDAALTLPVGKIRPEVGDLLRVTRESLDKAIDKVRPGNRLSDISAAVQQWVEKHGFSVVRATPDRWHAVRWRSAGARGLKRVLLGPVLEIAWRLIPLRWQYQFVFVLERRDQASSARRIP